MSDPVERQAIDRPPFPLPKLYNVADLLRAPHPKTNWLVENLMPAGYILMIFSPEGIGKSVLAYNLAVSIATGTKFLGLNTQSGTVLYMDEENPDSYMRDMLEKMLLARERTPESLEDRFIAGRFALLGKQPNEWAPPLEKSVEILKPTLMVFDTMSSLLPFQENVENDAAMMKGLMRHIRSVKDRSPTTTILILHHPNRANSNRPRGAGSIGQDVDGYWSLARSKGRPSERGAPTILKAQKSRALNGIPTYRITAQTNIGFDLVGQRIEPEEE